MITGLILCAIAYILVELVWGNRRDKEITESLPKGNFLFVDIETLGEVDELDFLSNNSTGFPAIGQICWILIDPKGKELFRRNLFSTDAPDSFLKKSENYQTMKSPDILHELAKAISQANYLVAHNIQFDKNVILGEAIRNNIELNIQNVSTICTMKLATEYCRLYNNGRLKWPKLTELHNHIFKDQIEEKHEAMFDTEICIKCFKHLYNERVITMKYIHKLNFNHEKN